MAGSPFFLLTAFEVRGALEGGRGGGKSDAGLSRLSCRCLGGRVIMAGLEGADALRLEAPNITGSPWGRTGASRGGPEVGRRKAPAGGASLHNTPVM